MTPDKYRVTQTRYLANELKASAGEVVYLCGGEARLDTEKTGQLHVRVRKSAGESFTIPFAHLHKIEVPQWP